MTYQVAGLSGNEKLTLSLGIDVFDITRMYFLSDIQHRQLFIARLPSIEFFAAYRNAAPSEVLASIQSRRFDENSYLDQ